MSSLRLSLIALVAVLGSALLIAPSADARKRGGGAPGGEPTAAQQEVRALKQQIAAAELHAALDLSAEQEAALADLASDVIAEREARRAERAAHAPELKGLLEDWLAEVRSTGSPSADTVAAVKAFREANRPDREETREARQGVRDALQSLLTESQQEVLRSFRPMAAAGPSDDERADRMEQRRERMSERGERRGLDGDRADAMIDRRMERGEQRRERRGAKRNVSLLLSPEMLALLD